MKRTLLFLASAVLLLSVPCIGEAATSRKALASGGTEAIFGTAGNDNHRLSEWQNYMAQSVEQFRMMRKSPVMQPDTILPAANSFGFLNAPDGSTWTYTIDFTTGERMGTYGSAHVKVYDSQHELLGEFTESFENIQERDPLITGVNDVQINPLITQKFFNLDASYELMLFIHATTSDYTGRYYSDVFSLGKDELVTSVPGNQVLAQNIAADAWSENYVLLFQRDSVKPIYEDVIDTTWVDGAISKIDTTKVTVGSDYTIYFDVYTKAGYSTPHQLAHTFVVDYDLISGSGSNSVPILMCKHNNQLCYVTARYEIPFFDPETPWYEDPVVQPNNHFLLTLHNSRFDTIATTAIPCESVEGYLYTFPYVGGLRYNDDLAFDFFPEADTAYIVSFDNYVTSQDEFVTSYYVYDLAGNRLKTVAENAEDYLWLSDVHGQEEQYCFLYSSDADATFRFVDVPSCQEVLRLPSTLNGNLLSSTLDRYPAGDSYQYVFSLAHGVDDSEGNTFHRVAWLNADGSQNRIDELNLGQGIQMAMVNIDASVLNPYIFNTDNDREYMVLVKRLQGTGSSASDELLYVVNTKGDRLLEMGPDETMGVLSGIALLNAETEPLLSVVYYNVSAGAFTPTYVDLPFNTFEGEGTAENPYLIATAGDFRQIKTALSAAYRVVDDLDFNNLPFAGIGGNFTGSIDGQNHVITNLALDGSGLFQQVSESSCIKDLRLYAPVLSLANGSSNVGFVVNNVTSNLESPCVISNVLLYNARTEESDGFGGNFGGIAGAVALGTEISQCALLDAEISLSEDAIAGGIVGIMNTASQVKACAFSGSLMAGTAAGIAGRTQNAAVTITNCHANAAIVGYDAAAGIVGENARSLVANCYAEGTLEAKGGWFSTVAGGVAGSVDESWDSATDTVVYNCLVGVSALTLPEGNKVYGHRVVGFSAGDNSIVDWDAMEQWTEDDWDAYDHGEKDYPRIPGDPDLAYFKNYVLSDLAVVDAAIEDAENTVEGATLAAEAFTEDFFAERGFAVGTTVDAPWAYAAVPYLWYEQAASALIVDNEENSLLIGDSLVVTFRLLNGKGSDIQVALSGDCAEIASREADGDHLALKVKATAVGTAVLTATYGNLTATATIACDKQHLNYDAQTGEVNVLYNALDFVTTSSEPEYRAHFLVIDRADESDRTFLIFYNQEVDADITVPAGKYSIEATGADWTVQASTGIDFSSTLIPSYYITIEDGYAKEMYFLVAGTVEVTKLDDGSMQVVVDALNSYDLPVHIEYSGAEFGMGTENISAGSNGTAHKYVRDGQLFIEYNGKTYNATGAVVE